MMVAESKKKANRKYDESHTTQVKMKLNLKTDKDILDHLKNVGPVQTYLKALIRADMQKK